MTQKSTSAKPQGAAAKQSAASLSYEMGNIPVVIGSYDMGCSYIQKPLIKTEAPRSPKQVAAVIGEDKKSLLKMARAGEKKPTEGDLLNAFNLYCSSHGGRYDEEFTIDLYNVSPAWFDEPPAFATNAIKKLLLTMAQNGNDAPDDYMGKHLASFITKDSRFYDKAFCQKLKGVNPSWVGQDAAPSDLPAESARPARKGNAKAELLAMAKNNEARPRFDTPYGRILTTTTSPKNRLYDEAFFRSLMKARPEWFLNSTPEYKEMAMVEITRRSKANQAKNKTPAKSPTKTLPRASEYVHSCFSKKY